jgi:hypothetical protein
MGVDTMTNHITISNVGGSLECEVLSFSGKHSCSVAKRKVPMRPNGEIIDNGTYVLKASSIKLTVRLSDTEKITLKNIYDSKTEVTITAIQDNDTYQWVYLGRFTSYPNNYEISYDGVVLREWITELEFLIYDISYELIE